MSPKACLKGNASVRKNQQANAAHMKGLHTHGTFLHSPSSRRPPAQYRLPVMLSNDGCSFLEGSFVCLQLLPLVLQLLPQHVPFLHQASHSRIATNLDVQEEQR